MDIQSIYGSTKTNPAAGPATDEDAPASGFAALLDMVSSQFKSTLGFNGALDPNVLKAEPAAEQVRAPEPRETKPRPERADERDAKAKPAKDEKDTDDGAADETAATDDQNAAAADAGAQDQSAQEQAAQVAVAAATDVAALVQTEVVAPVVVTEVAAEAVVETVDAGTVAAVTAVAAAETATDGAEAIVDPKAVTQTDVKAGEKVVAPEAVAKDTARVQQAMSAYAPAQETTDVEIAPVEAETVAVEAKAEGKNSAARTLDVRSAAAQDQANNLARLLGSENRIQVQVNVNAAHAAKQAVADVSVYNIYAGYTAADAISLANGQFGQAEEGSVAAQTAAPAPRMETATAAQATVIAQAAPLPQQAGGPATNTASSATPARADNAAPAAIQASTSSGGASNTSLGFSTFANSGATNTAQTQAAAQANPTDRPAATAQHVIDQIKVNITKAAKAGLDRVTIQLKPVELGRIEIKLEMSEDHKVRVTVTADNKDTLNLLQTDSRTLERTLNDAGLRTDANNLHFNLRSESDARSADGQNGPGGRNGATAQDEAAEDLAEPVYDYAAAANARGGVDTFA